MVNNIILKGIAFVANTIASFKEERGQDLIEYAVLAGGIGIALFAILTLLNLDAFRSAIDNCISMSGTCP